MITKYEKANAGKILAAVLVLAMVFAGAAVLASDSDVDAASSVPTELGGGLTPSETGGYVIQQYTTGEVIVVNDFIIPNNTALVINGAKFTVNEGVTITIQAGGQLVLLNGDITINGDIVAQGTNPSDDAADSPTNGYVAAIVNSVQNNTNPKTGVILNGSITLERGAEMVFGDNATVGVTPNIATIPDVAETSGEITLSDGASISVTKRSSSISVIENQIIYLNQGATFTLNGYANNVDVNATGNATYYTAGSMTINDGASTDFSTLTGNRTTSNLTFTVTTQTTSAITSVEENDRTITLRQYVLNVDGTVAGAVANNTATTTTFTDTLTFNSGYVYNGTLTEYTYATAASATFATADSDGARDKTIAPMTSITGSLTVDGNGAATISTDAYVTASGNVTIGYNDTLTDGSNVVISGMLEVTGTVTINGGSIDNSSNGYLYVNGGSVDITDFKVVSSLMMYGAYYLTSSSDRTTEIAHIRDLDVAVTEAAAAEADEVTVCSNMRDFGYTYIIDTNITIPDGMTLAVGTQITIDEDATLTFSTDADFRTVYSEPSDGMRIVVNGKLVDQGGIFDNLTDDIDYEVVKVSEDELTTTYTTLRIAIDEAIAGETIELNGQISITEDLTIPADVIVITDSDAEGADQIGEYAINISNDAVLTINGTLQIADGAHIIVAGATGSEEGAIVLNNIIANSDGTNIYIGTSGSTYTVPGAYFEGQISEDGEVDDYITTVAIAAENSAYVSLPGITINGKVSAGDATFTAGEDNEGLVLTIADGAEVTAGTFTLEEVSMTITGTFSGTVSSAVTAGTSSIAFSKSSGVEVEFNSVDDGETVTTTMVFSGTTLAGAATVSAGEVYVSDALTVGTFVSNTDRGILTIASGATAIVPASAGITVANNNATEAYAGLVVEGILTIDGGSVTTTAAGSGNANAGQIDVSGTFNVAGEDQTFAGVLNITGSLNVTSEGDDACKVTVFRMNVGNNEGASGTVTGVVELQAESSNNGGVIRAYPAADMSGAQVNLDAEGNTTANVIMFYINGDLYMTGYALDDVQFQYVAPASVSSPGYADVTTWYSTPEMEEEDEIDPTSTVNNITEAYAEAEPLTATVQISVGQGMSVFIDNVRYSNGQTVQLTFGIHSVSVQVNPGYTGTTSILFDGQAVTDGTFDITASMVESTVSSATIEAILSVTGEISVDTGSTDSSDDGMGIVEILLVILVVVVVILAIIVVLRMMRS